MRWIHEAFAWLLYQKVSTSEAVSKWSYCLENVYLLFHLENKFGTKKGGVEIRPDSSNSTHLRLRIYSSLVLIPFGNTKAIMCVLLLDSLRDNIRIPFVRVSTFSLSLHTKISHGQNSTILVPNSSTKMSGWKGENFPQNLVPFIWTVRSGDLKDNSFLVYIKSFEQVLML